MSVTTTDTTARPRATYTPAIGPKLKKLLYVVSAMLAVIGANSLYLSGITAVDALTGRTYENWFYQYMFLAHLALGLLFIVPFLVFAIIHMWNTFRRKNRRAVRAGYALFVASIVVLVSGLLLMRVGLFDLKLPAARTTVYWIHVGSPLLAGWLYWLHRLAGPPIRWRWAIAYGGIVGAVVAAMMLFHTQDPRAWNVAGPKSGEKYFQPSLARTSTGNFIPARALMMDDYCQKCHPDVHARWADSVHHFSSFNNPAYLASVRETRDVVYKRDGTVQASRWCAGCHDPVPFFSGAFDDPKFDDVKHKTAHAGITCTTCHAITHLGSDGVSNRGNGDYTIEEPLHYPFAYSEHPVLQWINNQLVKAKPSFHKKTFLKPFHKSAKDSTVAAADFCSVCHKVHLPKELNHYKEFLRGQNHYDSWLLSGVSGHGSQSFYFPPEAQTSCNRCHMPLQESSDFGAQFFDDSGKLTVHDHLFPSANTGIAWLREKPEVIREHQKFLEGVMRVDIFGVKEGGSITGKLYAPLRPKVPELKPGETYLLETVIRTVKMGHLFTQGTADSNEVWLDITVTADGKVIGRSGALDERKHVDPWSHFVNAFVVDKDGNRIDRRNAQDIVVALYNHQIPPGAGQTVHFRLSLPDNLSAPVTVDVKLQYRKFDGTYMDFVAKNRRPGDVPLRGHTPGKPYVNNLPITTLAHDRVTFPVAGVSTKVTNSTPEIDAWMRWNDYGIGLFLKGKKELRQAADAFSKVEEFDRYDGPLNLARVLEREGDLNEAVDAIRRAAAFKEPSAPPWTIAWLSGVINRQQNRLEEAQENFEKVLTDQTADMRRRRFDFSLDYRVRNLLGETLFDRSRGFRTDANREQRVELLRQAAVTFKKTLAIDSENVTAHANLAQIYKELGETEKATKHRRLHDRYRPDDTARGRAIRLAREKYPAANDAADEPVIYSLNRDEDERASQNK
jgi:hypothetical protein